MDEAKIEIGKTKEENESRLAIGMVIVWFTIIGGSFYLHETGTNILGFLVILGIVLFIIGFFKVMLSPLHGKLK